MKHTPEIVTELSPNQVFVFGSNLSGIHGAGAAKTALQWGAVMGQGIGHHGRTYALPTKDFDIETLPLSAIEGHVYDLVEYALEHPELEFLVTKVGCGLAGYSASDIAPFFHLHPENMILPEEFNDAICELSAQIEKIQKGKTYLAC